VDYLEGGDQHLLAGYLAGAVIDESVPAQLSIRIAPSAHQGFRGHARAVAMITAALRDLLATAKLRVRVR
jgi:hypothetical protein